MTNIVEAPVGPDLVSDLAKVYRELLAAKAEYALALIFSRQDGLCREAERHLPYGSVFGIWKDGELWAHIPDFETAHFPGTHTRFGRFTGLR